MNEMISGEVWPLSERDWRRRQVAVLRVLPLLGFVLHPIELEMIEQADAELLGTMQQSIAG